MSALTAVERVAVRREGVAAFLRRPEAPRISLGELDHLLCPFTDAADSMLAGSGASLRLTLAYVSAIQHALGVEYTTTTRARIDTLVAALREDVGTALFARLNPRAMTSSAGIGGLRS